MKRTIFIGTLIFLGGWAVWAQEGSEPSVAFEDSVVVIGAMEGVSEISIRVPPGKEPVSLTDAGVPESTKVTFTASKPRRAVKGPSGENTWRYVVEVKSLPLNTTQKRSATVTMAANSTKTLDYWLTNRSSALTTTKVDHWVIRDLHPWDDSDRCKKIMVYSGDIPGTSAQLLQANVERERPHESPSAWNGSTFAIKILASPRNPSIWRLIEPDLSSSVSAIDSCGRESTPAPYGWERRRSPMVSPSTLRFT